MNKINDNILKNLEIVEQQNRLDQIKTERQKNEFVKEIKYGLGRQIKKNSNIKFIKKPWYYKLKMVLKKLFTKF